MKTFASLALACMLCATPAFGAPLTAPRPEKNVETRILSDKMTYFADKQQIIFDKNVYVKRPDFELWADTLTVYLKPAPPANEKNKNKGSMPAGMAAGDVDRLVAERNVRMKSENRTGTCGKATYTVDKGLLVMEQNPHLSDGENTITGELVRYFTQENRSEVEGSSNKRVEAVFSSPDKPAAGGR